MKHICISKIIIIGSDNGLSLDRHQAIICTDGGILIIGPLGINFCKISIAISTFSFKKMHLKMSSAKWRLFSLGLNELSDRSTQSQQRYQTFYIVYLQFIAGSEWVLK